MPREKKKKKKNIEIERKREREKREREKREREKREREKREREERQRQEEIQREIKKIQGRLARVEEDLKILGNEQDYCRHMLRHYQSLVPKTAISWVLNT
ncbi:uncharacterized protein BJX67DRAFT_148829 [Aspergillus lucknowensis]|uniref:BZIP domain-containing protein n=1 Tax=Aspergillus lucknowensis TaxID=176173 RepID=A0ABR4LNR1_9EURO